MRVPPGSGEITEPPPSAIVTRSGIRKLVRIPPISTPWEDSRGKPLIRTPTSVEVPPTSTTSESVVSVRNAAPRMLLAGPLPMVSTGYRRAWSRAISVPSFWAKNVAGARPCAASASCIALATSRATSTRAAFRIVAFSRSSRPTEPISWLSETCTSPSSRLTTPAASSSCRGETGANTLVIATASAAAPTSPRNRATASPSNGDRSRPSNSMPPSTTVWPTETASARSGGHSNIGLMLWVAGPPILITATRRSLLRSRTALVACVVPSITWVIRAESMPGARSTASMAAVMPPVMSAVQATLALAITRSAGSMTTASVLVPPTSMPRRQSSCGTGKLLHWQVVEVIPERPRAGDGESRVAAPDRVAAEGDHRDPLAVPDPLGHDRVGGLAVQYRDQVRDRGQHPPPLQRDEVLVLQLQPDQAARVIAAALDQHGAADKSLRRPPLDVRHLPGDEPEGAELRYQRGHRIALRTAERLADPDGERHRVPHRRPAGLRHGERVLGRRGGPAELDGRGPLQALHPVARDRPEHDQVAALVGHDGRARRDPGQVHGDLRDLGKGPAHAVGVHDRQSHPRGPGNREQAVRPADLGRHERRDAAAGHVLQVLAQPGALVPVPDFLDADRRGADPPARHDQCTVRQLIQVDEGHWPVILGRLKGLQQAGIRIAAAAGTQDRAPPGEGTQAGRIE